jgi:hypothetical protein
MYITRDYNTLGEVPGADPDIILAQMQCFCFSDLLWPGTSTTLPYMIKLFDTS